MSLCWSGDDAPIAASLRESIVKSESYMLMVDLDERMLIRCVSERGRMRREQKRSYILQSLSASKTSNLK